MRTTERREAEEIGRRLRAARELADLSQAQAAKELGIEVRTLRRYELGKRKPTGPILERAGECYGSRRGAQQMTDYLKYAQPLPVMRLENLERMVRQILESFAPPV